MWLDRFEIDTPLGLRFWDSVDARFVGDGLIVTAVRRRSPDWVMTAMPNHSGTFVFHSLSLRRELSSAPGPQSSPPTVSGLTVTVRDQWERFQPFQFSITEPTRGLFDWPGMDTSPLGSPIASDLPVLAVPLFSSPTRPVPAGMAVVRAELRPTIPVGRQHPGASWAVMSVLYKGRTIGRGVADADGRLAVILSYPPPAISSTGSGVPAGALPLCQQSWPISIEVQFQTPDPELSIPDLARILTGPRVTLQESYGSDGPPGALTVSYGQETIVRTLGKSELYFINP